MRGTASKTNDKTETWQNKYKLTNGTRKVSNNPNQSLFWNGIDLPVPDLSKSTNSQSDKEITGNGTFQIDSFLEENNQFLIETNELIRHYDVQVIRECRTFIEKVEEKCKKKMNK